MNPSKTFIYEFSFTDWDIDVEFNHFASMTAWESDIEFEEAYSILLKGHMTYSSCDNNKIKYGLYSELKLKGVDFWYEPRSRFTDEEDRSIGRTVYHRYYESEKKGHYLDSVVYLSRKSYQTVLGYISNKGALSIQLSGEALKKAEDMRGVLRSDIYYINIKGDKGFGRYFE